MSPTPEEIPRAAGDAKLEDAGPAARPPEPEPADAPPGEPEAWAAVLAAWEDEAAHRAYLAGLTGLEALAVAGGRYRAVLEARPDDPIARRGRDEVVKRATVAGLALLPRTTPPSRSVRARAIAIAVAIVLGVVAATAGRAILHAVRELWP